MTTQGRRFLLVCGGTGGHLAPGIALAERLIRLGHSCQLVVSEKTIDGRLSKKYTHLDFVTAPGAPLAFSRQGLWRFVRSTVRALIRSREIMKTFQPDVTVVFGGFLSPTFVLWSRLMGLPVALHEANQYAGKAVRVLSRISHRVYAPEGVRTKGLNASKLVTIGYPLRLEIRPLESRLARTRWGLTNDAKTLVILGGSQGAMALNQWVDSHYQIFSREGFNVIAVSGPTKGTHSSVELTTVSGEKMKAIFLPFVDDMSSLLTVADVVISRAGAGAIAELIACAVPSILVPYPYAADKHQEANARRLEEQGGCVVMDQDVLEEQLLKKLYVLLSEQDRLDTMRATLERLSKDDAAEAMALSLVEWVETFSGRSASFEGKVLA